MCKDYKVLVNAQKCNYGEMFHKKSHLKFPGGLKSQQTLISWPFFFSTIRLTGSSESFERCPLTGGKKDVEFY